jgi:NAD(P)H dehydrogenase (quinone)
MSDFSNSILGLTGGSGNVGRAVIGYLKARGARHIVAVTRNPSKLADVTGIEVRQGDLNDPSSLDAAFKGIDRLLIVSTDTFGVRIALQTAAIDAAERAGVGHLLYTSIPNPYPHAKHLAQNEHFWTEARMFEFKGGWTALRDNLYADYILWGAQKTIAEGKLVHAGGTGRRAVLMRDDIAATAAGALLTAEGREVVDVSGPEALSYADIAAILSRVSGKPVEAVAISKQAQIDGMIAGGVPLAVAEALAGFDEAASRDAMAVTSDAVRRVAGREPKSVEAMLTEGLKPSA